MRAGPQLEPSPKALIISQNYVYVSHPPRRNSWSPWGASMSSHSNSFVKIPRRSLTSQQATWIRDIVLANPDWADVNLENLHIVAECGCGCRSVVLEEPPQLQNPKFLGHQGLVGEISLGIKVDGREDVISVLLHFAEGSLSLLEVIWYNEDPIPATWTEISRDISVGR